MNEVKDTSLNYEVSSITGGLTQSTIYTDIDFTNVGSTSKIYNAQNVIDKNNSTYAEVDKNVYTSDDGGYTGSETNGEHINIYFPVALQLTDITITNASSSETVTVQKYSDGLYPSLEDSSQSKNKFYAKRIAVYGNNSSGFTSLGTIENTENGTSLTITDTGEYTSIRLVISQISNIEYTYEHYYYDTTFNPMMGTTTTTLKTRTKTDYMKHNAFIAGFSVNGLSTQQVDGYSITSGVGIQKRTTNPNLSFNNANNLLIYNEPEQKIELHEFFLDFTNNSMNFHPLNVDGSFYRYSGQFYCSVDDSFYIRDSDNTTIHQYLLSTHDGFRMWKGRSSDKEENGYGFMVNSDGTHNRMQITQYEDGSGGYFYYNRTNNFGTSSDRRLKENIMDIDESDIDF